MEKILFINQWPSHLTKDIINTFAEKFNDIGLIAGYISESGSPLNKKVKICRIIKYNKSTVFSRVTTWILATIQIIILVNIKFRKYHLFITSNPPLSTFIPLFCRNHYSIQILDIYPDALVAGGFISQKSWINKMWRRQNIFTITSGMAKTLSPYCNSDKIKVIAQWPPTDGNGRIERSQNIFIQTHSLKNNFVVMYSGNIGLGHHVDTIVETARILKDFKNIMFVIIGEGWNKPMIERLIKEYGLKNCLLLPFQPSSMFKHSSQAADIGVVSVSKELAMLSVPIKTYNLISKEIPLLCVTEGQSELAALVSKYEIGKCFTPHQVNEISDFIISLKTNNEIITSYKKNLKNCAQNFTSRNALLYVNNFNV
jgi:hypothetical protein